MRGKHFYRRLFPLFLPAALLLVLLPLLSCSGKASTERWAVYSFHDPVLRLHILAHSDTPRDQRVKTHVAVATNRFLQSRITESGFENKDFLESIFPELEQELSLVLERLNYPMAVKIRLVREKFPLRAYGRHVYPPGSYPALKIILGRGKGENWWCLLFPPLCLPVVETPPADEPGGEVSSDPPVRFTSPSLSGNPSGSARWTFKIRERVHHWIAGAGSK